MTFEKVQGILSAASAFMRRVFQALHFTGIIFYLAHTQGRCGADGCRLWQSAGMGGRAAAALQNFFNLSFRQVRILADFTGESHGRAIFLL